MHKTLRAKQAEQFLEQKAKLRNYRIESMGFDASSRKYFRVYDESGKTKILVDDEGCNNRPKEFIELSKFLNGHGIRAPKVLAKCLRKGFMLVEDFGNTDFVKVADGKNDKELLRKAVDILVKLHKVRERPKCVSDMDKKVIRDNFALFSDWYVPACLGRQLTPEQRKEFFKITDELTAEALRLPETLVLWDYHVNNVMYPENSKEAALIDFQDALWGPGLYDLASLIEDERRDVPQEITDELKEYYFEQMGNLPREDFDKAYDCMALLRHMRVLGRFTTLITVKHRDGYGKYVPHGLELLKRSLQNPRFAKLKKWMEGNFSESYWGVPQDKNITKGFVLAAGRGTRMRHLTQTKAKPMVEVAGRGLIDYGLDIFKNAGVLDAVVNVCYKKEGIIRHLKKVKGFNFKVSEEKEALETGGGIKKALKFFEGRPFAVVNSDNILIDDGYKPILRQMFDVWNEEKHDILLLLKNVADINGDKPRHGDYKVQGERILRNKEKVSGEGFDYCYVGIAIIHPRIFDNSPKGKFSLVELFDKAEANGRLGFAFSDRQQFLVGSPEAVEETQKILTLEK